MSKTTAKFFILGLLFVISQSSFALSLGGIKVMSTFAQPFLAEIKLPSYTNEEIESIQIALAPNDLFLEQGIEIIPILRKLRFSVEDKKDGTLYIKVHTKTAVKELSISFLLEVTWHGGRIIKNYDVLLTPEAITQAMEKKSIEAITGNDNQTTLKTNATTQTVKKKAQKKGTKKKSRVQQIAQSPSKHVNSKSKSSQTKLRKTKNGGIVYSPVGSGESLSLIAKKIRPNDNMSINQVMVALFNENRSAFMNNNINRLQIGATLTIKDSKSITGISKRKATQLASQYLKGPVGTDEKPAMIAENHVKEVGTEIEQKIKTLAEPSNRLVISSANEDPVPLEIIQKIKNEELAADEEEIKAANLKVEELRTENKLLKERIADLEQKRDAAIEKLFLATIDQKTIKNSPDANSLTQQDENLLVASTDLGMDGNEKLSIMEHIEKYQTAISVGGVALLSMTLIGMRKKEEILDIVDDLRSRFSKS